MWDLFETWTESLPEECEDVIFEPKWGPLLPLSSLEETIDLDRYIYTEINKENA